MNRIRCSITDRRLAALIRDADPVLDTTHSPGILTPREQRLMERVLAGKTGAGQEARLIQHVPPSKSVVSRTVRHRSDLRRRLVLSAISGGGLAAAVTATIVFTASHSPSVAFADWSAAPTAPAHGQVQAAEADCQRNSALASLKPALIDTRRAYTLLVYSPDSLCIAGPSLQSPTGEPATISFGSFLTSSSAAAQRAAVQRGAPSNIEAQNATSLSPDAIRILGKGGATAKTSVSGKSAEYSFDVGRTGATVAAVTLVLRDGDRVEATTANGWFAAWWPGGEEARTAEITTTRGTTTQQLMPTATTAP